MDYLSPDAYSTGQSWGDDGGGAYAGHDYDHLRWSSAEETVPPPMQDRPGTELFVNFGSAHPSGFHVVMCDGSVQVVSYGIDRFTHAQLGNRHDGIPVDLGSL